MVILNLTGIKFSISFLDGLMNFLLTLSTLERIVSAWERSGIIYLFCQHLLQSFGTHVVNSRKTKLVRVTKVLEERNFVNFLY